MWPTRRQKFGSVKYCWPVICWPAIDVPEPELGLEPARGVAGDAPRHERLRAGGAPRLEARRRVEGRALGKRVLSRPARNSRSAAGCCVMMPATRCPRSPSPAKSATAIGIGWNWLPGPTRRVSWACAGRRDEARERRHGGHGERARGHEADRHHEDPELLRWRAPAGGSDQDETSNWTLTRSSKRS